jgi:FkbM family methyltransferase
MSKQSQLRSVFSALRVVATNNGIPASSRGKYVRRYVASLPAMLRTPPSNETRTTHFLGGNEFRFTGAHSNLVLDHINSHLLDYAPYHENAKVVLDVGASFGTFALMVSQLTPDATVYAFEPSYESFELLKTNVASVKNIHAINQAVGADERTVKFQFNADQPEWSQVTETGEGYAVEQTSLDSFVARNAITSIDLLKIDVEGYELAVLEGARATLDMCMNVIIETEVLRMDNLARVAESMSTHGLRLAGFGDINRHDGRMASVDLIFQRTKVAQPALVD